MQDFWHLSWNGPVKMTPKERAENAANAMWENDHASQALGMELISVDEGVAVFQMLVKKQHLNGHGSCHGGMIFALADTAFAFACNSRNQATVAQHNSITYLAPAAQGDVLMARAAEVNLTGRGGITDVSITNQARIKIAEFRGHSRAVRGSLFPEDPA